MTKVLIVDDSSMVRRYHRSALVSGGFAVDEALNGLEALEKILADAPDLLIVDVNMPKMDGISFLRALRRQPLPLAAIPAVVISTEAARADMDSAFAAGANFYLVKPVVSEVIVQYAKLLCGIAP